MATMNESVFNTPSAKRALKLHEARINAAAEKLSKRGREMNFERRLATAQCLENTRRQIKAMEALSMGQATQPSSVGQYKRFAMDMVATLVPNLIAPDLVSVQAIDNRVGMINILEYQYGDDKGVARRGQTFASPLAYQGTDVDYTSATVKSEVISDGQTTLTWVPVKPETFHVYRAGQVVSGITVEIDGTINGEIKAGDVVSYFYDNETVPVNAPTIKLDIRSIPVETKSRKLKAIWSFDAAYELTKEYGQDMQTMLATQSTAEIQQEIDNEVMYDLLKIANAGPEVVWSRTQPPGVNMIDHYDTFFAEIVKGSNQIFQATRRAHANFMVCGIGVASVMQVMRNFDGAEDLTAIGPHFIGTLSNGIRCYVNPNFDENVFVLGYKGNTLIDAGYVYAPYMPIMTTGMITLADDFAAREGWATSYGTKAINPRLYVRGRII